MLKHIPNILTILRFFMIPIIIIACVNSQYITAIIILTISGVTDILDGTIARMFNWVTDFGKLMDPMADKITQICILMTLYLKKMIPIWIVAIVVVKEFCMVTGASFLYGKELVVSSKWYGKLATVLFYIAIVMTLLVKYTEDIITIIIINQIIYYLAIITTIASLILYIKAFYICEYLKKE